MVTSLRRAALCLALVHTTNWPGDTLAAEASLPDGGRLKGQLLSRDGRLTFVPAGAAVPLPFAQVLSVDFPDAQRVATRGGLTLQVTLPGGQHLTGDFLDLDTSNLVLRTTWAERLSVPRAAILGVRQSAGMLTFVADDFETGPVSWRVAGGAAVCEGPALSGKHSLRLGAAGQVAEFSPTVPVPAGRVAVSFLDPRGRDGPEVTAGLEFSTREGPWWLKVAVSGSGHYRVTAPQLPDAVALPRSAGWHRLQMEWAAGLMLVSVDDVLLYPGRFQGPAGPLRKVRLANAGGVPGEVCFDDFTLAREVPLLRREPTDPEQDEVWLASGDQLLGDVGRADRRGVEIEGRFGKRVLPWGEVRGIYPRRREAAPGVAPKGETIRARFHPGYGDGIDELEGTLLRLDEKQLTLRHPLLGEVNLERSRLLQVRPPHE